MNESTVKTIIANFTQLDLVVERLLLAPVQGSALINVVQACKNSVQQGINEAQELAAKLKAFETPAVPPAPVVSAAGMAS